MSRSFSTSARNLFQIIWENTDRMAKYDDAITQSIEENAKLRGRVDKVEIAYVASPRALMTGFFSHN